MKKLLLFFCLCISTGTIAQQVKYRNLVLEGGGIWGVAYGGALKELDSLQVLPHIQRVAGTSAGAIQAALLSVGYTPAELTEITFNTPIEQFNDGRFIFFGGTNRLFKQYGWYRGDKLTDWIGRLIQAKTGDSDITFAELHQLAGKGNYRDLYVTGTNLTDQCVMVFSHETSPQMQVKHAVRISMSIPLYYRAVLLDQEGNVVTKPRKGQQLDVLVDGGILANYPINLFDDIKYVAGAAVVAADFNAQGLFYNPETLGLRLDRDEQIQYDREQAGLAPFPITRFSDYMGAFYTLVEESLNRQQLTPQDWSRTISISTKGLGQRVRKLNETEKSILLNSGKAGVQAFMNRK
ncbi:patatin-like phospholipase family protein [Pontibacter sp. MBLB2868]|uniref:patatin-like phospholipase family protein n=1 Tax=Pontibacter sp. MBLB2868 TaxID=3451555 RepID=UPI003F74CB6F